MQKHIMNDITNKNVIIFMNATHITLQHQIRQCSMQIKLELVSLRFSRKRYNPLPECYATKPSLTRHSIGDATNKNHISDFPTFTVKLHDHISFCSFYKIR